MDGLSTEGKMIPENMSQQISPERVDSKTLRAQKRQYTRVGVSYPVAIINNQGAIQGEAKNLSFGGALIIVHELPTLNGAPLELAIQIPDYNYAIFVVAEVVRVEVYEVNGSSVSYSLGVRFSDISEEDLDFLATEVLY